MPPSNTANPKPVDKQSVYELRKSISELLREDFTDRLADLERCFNELMQELEKKESAPPRSDFWNLRVIIVKENQSNYNRINNTEAVAGIWQALKLEHVGKPDHMKLACRTGDEYGDSFVVHIADFEMYKFPVHMRTMCNNFFNNVVKFEFFMQPKRREENTCDTTTEAEMMTALCKIHSSIVEIEGTRLELKQKMYEHTNPLKEVLKNELETRTDSEPEESDLEDDSDDELEYDKRAQSPSPKRRKTYDEMGVSKETDQQQISLVGITLSPGASVESLRIREFRGEPEPHFVDLMGAISTLQECIISKRLPCPRAPVYSHGAEPNSFACGNNFKLEAPGEDVNSDTVVTQKMIDIDRETGTNLVGEYEAMHQLAYALRAKIRDMVRAINNDLDFIVRVHTSDGQHADYHVNNLTLMQRYAIGNLYLDSIAVNKDEAAHTGESDDEGAEEDGEEDDEQGDSDTGSVYESGDSSDDEEEGDEEEEEEDDDEQGDSDPGSVYESGDSSDDEEEEDDDDEGVVYGSTGGAGNGHGGPGL